MVDEKLRPSFGTGERVPAGGEQDPDLASFLNGVPYLNSITQSESSKTRY
jgi:hypothetical protein